MKKITVPAKNFDVEILSLDHVKFRVDYYSSNKEHLEVWHPTTPDGFYTFKYQESKVKENLDLIEDGKSMHFVMVNKSKTKMLGHCNYTKIKQGRCWLGYSISKEAEGKSLMYEALLITNIYMQKNLKINEIRAGILPENERSIRLIKRLNFKYVGEKDELEINGEKRTYETYLMEA